MKLRKIRRPVQIARTVRTENGFTDGTNRTICENDLRIVNIVFQSVKQSGCYKAKLRKIRRSVPYEREISCPDSHIWLAWSNQPGVYINSVLFLSKIIFVLRTVDDGFFVMKNVCDIVRRFVAVMSNHDIWH